MLGLELVPKDTWQSLQAVPSTVDALKRGDLELRPFNDAVGDGYIYQVSFPRPPQLRPPNFMMLQLHTTGLKARVIGHENEISGWTLMTPDDKWVSYRSNQGVRDAPDEKFYPCDNQMQPMVKYFNSSVSDNSGVFHERQVHIWSWVNPNWAYTSIRHYGQDDAGTTVQDMRFSLVCGDTLETASILSGSGTQVTLVLSP